ncbi:Syd protein [Streptomyces sp. NBRC 110611]|uniref:hypothetical protein n=1 Tax=Streptomyces sp. NBRC 110611 TaxID=1621259 RepID=UPI00085755F8|nr:hypothetical protein [Streptomyces sp. NBRC 110611]GAU70381.1 Syd protein [Streptomyces sp. NBRC 110611]
MSTAHPPTRRAVLAAALGGAVAVAAPPRPAAARTPVHSPVITSRAPTLHPEGVTWDPTRQAFLVGSVRHGTVSVVRPDGTVRTLVDDRLMVSTLGITVDPVRRRVLATYQDPGFGTRTSCRTRGKQSGLGIFDLTTGAPLHRVDLSTVPGSATGVHGADDVAVDAHGNAYVTDIVTGELYRVDPAGQPSLLLRNPDLLGRRGVGPNGIVWCPTGHLLVARYDTGTLLRVPVHAPDRARPVSLRQPLIGADGLALRADGSLAVVTNRLASDGPTAVTILRSTDDWTSATATARHTPWPDATPTTAAATPHGTYVVDGRLPQLFAGAPTDGFVLRRLPWTEDRDVAA